MAKPTIIAIAGASASGKSLFASTVYQELVAEFGGERISVLAEDAYYRNQDHLSMDQRVLTNYDHPAAFEHELLAQHLQQLRLWEIKYISVLKRMGCFPPNCQILILLKRYRQMAHCEI